MESEALVSQAILADPPNEPYEMPHLRITNAERGLDGLRKKTSFPLLLIMSITGVILLVSCANIAGLMMAKGAARRREEVGPCFLYFCRRLTDARPRKR